MTYLLILLFSFSVFAHESCNQLPAVMSDDLTKLADAVALEWWSVSPTQFDNAVCKNHDVPDWDAYFTSLPSGRRRDREVRGFAFKNESSEMIDAFRDLYSGSAPVVKSSCTTVLCAVDAAWGVPLGRKLLYIKMRHGYNTSEYTRRNARRLNETELNDILVTFGDLPPELINLGRGGNQPMVLAAEADVAARNPLASADSAITFFDRWRTTSTPFNRQYGLYHEFAHNMARVGGGNHGKKSEWRDLAKDCPVSTYGQTNSEEDFAETVIMYRFHGQGLKDKCPAKYDYLKNNIFSEREYLSGSSCH